MNDLSATVVVLALADLALVSAAVYLLPVVIAWARQVPGIGSVAVLNVLLGWTLIGWAAALAMALRPAPDAAAAPIARGIAATGQPLVPRQDRGQAGRECLRPPREGTPPPLELPSRQSGPVPGC